LGDAVVTMTMLGGLRRCYSFALSAFTQGLGSSGRRSAYCRGNPSKI